MRCASSGAMDRTLIICGSAGRGGVTETMCQAAAERLRRDGHDAFVAFPSEMRIEHCRGCNSCRDGPCVIDDDMHVLYRLFSESDFLILATPLHFNGPSSLVKTVMDRFQMYWFGRDLPHPLAMSAMVCAGSDRPNFAPVLSIMRAFAATTGMQWHDHLEVPGTDRTGDQGVAEMVDGFISSIEEAEDRISWQRLRPPCSDGRE